MYAGDPIKGWLPAGGVCKLTMGGGVIQVKVGLLDTLSVIALGVAEAKQSFLEKVVLLVPEGKGNVLKAMSVTDSRYAIFAPSVRTGSRMVVGEMAPGIAVVRVVFSNSRPLSFRHIRTPFLPVFGSFAVLLEPLLLLAKIVVIVDNDHVGKGMGEGRE